MNSMSNKVSVIFVPGGWHRAGIFDKVCSILGGQYLCKALDLPTIASGDISTTFADDVKAVRDCLESEIKQGHRVAIVAHSYGAIVGQSAVKGFNTGDDGELLDVPARPIIGIVIIASMFAQPGKTIIEMLGGKPFPFMTLDDDGYSRLGTPARDLFYNDLEEDEAAQWVEELRPQSKKFATEGGEASYPGWRDAPCWYIMTSDDQALPVAAQHMVVQAAREVGADVIVREITSSHSPMLSKPEETASIIQGDMTAFLG